MNWAAQEMSDIDLGDKRLNQRVVKVLSDLAGNPTKSIPAACGGWRETKAAYRLFDNNKVNGEKLLPPHEKATLERIKSQNTVLLLQDTTSFCFSTQRKGRVSSIRMTQFTRLFVTQDSSRVFDSYPSISCHQLKVFPQR
jgi:hypothetical protein